jgi:hypothetical protein
VKKTISDVFRVESVAPLAFIEQYNKYHFIFTNENDDEVEAFLRIERNWDELAVEVGRFHELTQEIPSSHEQKIVIGIFDVYCDELIQILSSRAAEVRDKFIDKMVHELHEALNA